MHYRESIESVGADFTREGTLSQHGERLASQLAKLLTHHSVLGVGGSEERDDRTSLAPLEKMILTQWNYYNNNIIIIKQDEDYQRYCYHHRNYFFDRVITK